MARRSRVSARALGLWIPGIEISIPREKNCYEVGYMFSEVFFGAELIAATIGVIGGFVFAQFAKNSEKRQNSALFYLTSDAILGHQKSFPAKMN